MSCDRITEQLPAYVSGQLSGGERSEVARHLEGCTACTQERDSVEDTVHRLGAAPLAHTPPRGLEARVFERIALEPVGDLVAAAPIEGDPPDDLERRALAHAGVLTTGDGNRPMLQRAVAPGLAAAVVALGFFGMQWRNDARVMTQQFGPPGETLQQVSFKGPSPFPPGGGADLEIVHYDHDNYGVVIEARKLPICRVNYHYEVWVSGDRGQALLGSFTVPGKGVYNFPMGLDPADYEEIKITHEPASGSPEQDGDVLWMAPLP